MFNKNIYLLLLLLFLIACGKEKLLQKNWVVTQVEFINSEKNKADTLEGKTIQNITKNVLKELLINVQYQFGSDHLCKITGNNHTTVFNYKLVRGNTFIEFSAVNNSSNKKEIAIEKLSANELVMITENDQSSLKTKLYLKPLP